MGYNNGLLAYLSKGTTAAKVMKVLAGECGPEQRGMLVAHCQPADVSALFVGEVPSLGVLSFPGGHGLNPDALAWRLAQAGVTALALCKSDFYQYAAWQLHAPTGSLGQATSTGDYHRLSLRALEALTNRTLRLRKTISPLFLDETLGQLAADEGTVLRFAAGWRRVAKAELATLPWKSWNAFSAMTWPANLRTLKAQREARASLSGAAGRA